ncbi:EscU/YscU/HrcU family type III secretion system export apparatus switch protein [Ruicaihuangia caeni]|uniref:EscU/YscU/HrcU family type III secretion system export apparatus switch protein n=1 Tax=Ruicaihuangia caeni TaxID=3042517 RepID=A0AAW6T3J7_9MICO|nr:EscU/YscU/HrcU family type III secretion system export apparatus switch protein [Klugiella sp. YN-L-19]MDI2097899.1 EscU/YscU/HrcU family type III secretion system export apparatus switch protein [Klugiella sp. YN-L-19]
MTDTGERTEQATPKRMREARRKGQLSRSQDLTAWLGIAAGGAVLPGTVVLGAGAMGDSVLRTGGVIANPEPARAFAVFEEALGATGSIMLPLLATVAAVVVAGAAVQGGVHLKPLRGRFEQFDLVKGTKRVFGTQALWQGAKALLKTAVVGLVLVAVVQGLMPHLLSAGALPIAALLDAAASGIGALIQAAVIAGIALAIVDVLVVARRNRKHTRMTKREVRDEHKNSEGDPLIRQQRRSRQLAMSRNRMIAAVAGADVVLLNPTHLAVGLRYEQGKSAPRVVAKGRGVIAARIRTEAERHGVPMVHDKPLARALHSVCDIGDEIPIELYNAVATVLAFVMALKRRGSQGGVHRIDPRGSSLPATEHSAEDVAASTTAQDDAPAEDRVSGGTR